ncbi:MAG: YjfB family protein [Spirochaetia bacterium]
MLDSISSTAMNMSQSQLMQQVQVSMLDKNLETAETQGDQMAEMLRESGQAAQKQAPITDTAKGQNVDIFA